MMNPRRTALPLLTILLLWTMACQEQPEAADRDSTPASATELTDTVRDTAATSGDPASAATRAALPRLFAIMTGLQADMERISRGLWIESYDSIAAGARAVADHPMIGEEGLAKIQGALGDDIARFKAMDTNVHDLAVQLAEEAGAADIQGALDTEAELRQGCVECHTEFRQRLRDAMSDGTAGGSAP